MPHRRNIDMDLLRSFVTILEVKSFTRAAERLRRTQSAISLQMKRLEEQLDCRLFERGGRGVEPTEPGIILLGYARRILAANDELVGRMAEPMVEGRVHVGAPDEFASDYLAPLAARFLRAFPRAELTVLTGTPEDLKKGLDEGRLDVAVISRIGDPGEGELLSRQALLWCAAEGEEQIGLPGADGEPLMLVANKSNCPARRAAEAALTEAGIPWRLTFEASSNSGVQAAIAAGLGIGALPRGSIQPGVFRLPSRHGLPRLPDLLVMLVLKTGASAAAERLHGFLVQLLDRRI